MRRSSWAVLIAAVAILAVLAVLFGTPAGSMAPPMTTEVARAIIEHGRRAMEAGDVDGVMNLIAPDAKLLEEHGTDDIRPLLEQAVKELGKSKLEIKCG